MSDQASVSPVPPGFGTVTPHLIVRDAAAAIEFYKRAFGATEVYRMPFPDGKLGHAEIEIGGSRVMMADEFPAFGSVGPKTLRGTSVTMHLYVDDADAWAKRAVAAGAKITMPLADMFWGDRYGTVEDPFGHKWSLATHLRDVSPTEMEAAMAKMAAQMPPPKKPAKKAAKKKAPAKKVATKKVAAKKGKKRR